MPGGRLVEQQQLAARWPAPGRSPAGAGRRRGGSSRSPRPTVGDADELQQLQAAAAALALLPAVPGQAQRARRTRRSGAARRRRPSRSPARSCWRTAGCSGTCGPCRAGHLVRLLPGRSRLPSNRTSPSVGVVDAGDDVEHGRLAGAVRPDQREDLALVDAELDVVQRDHAAEAHRDARRAPAALTPRRPVVRPASTSGGARDGSSSASTRWSATGRPRHRALPSRRSLGSSARRCRDGSRPSGRKIIMITSAAPKVSTRYSSNPRNRSGSQAMRNAPRMTPGRLPDPPSTTAARISADRMNGKLTGVIEVVWEAKTTPAEPPIAAPMVNAPQLEPERRHAHQLGGVLVLPDRRPGPADPAVLQPLHDDDHHDDDQEQQVVVRLGVEHAVPQRRDAEDLERAVRRRVRDRRDAARAAEPVGVVGGDADDLAEPERDDGQVVAAQSQRRRAQDAARRAAQMMMPTGRTTQEVPAVLGAEHRHACRRRWRRRRRSRGRAGRPGRRRRSARWPAARRCRSGRTGRWPSRTPGVMIRADRGTPAAGSAPMISSR